MNIAGGGGGGGGGGWGVGWGGGGGGGGGSCIVCMYQQGGSFRLQLTERGSISLVHMCSVPTGDARSRAVVLVNVHVLYTLQRFVITCCD